VRWPARLDLVFFLEFLFRFFLWTFYIPFFFPCPALSRLDCLRNTCFAHFCLLPYPPLLFSPLPDRCRVFRVPRDDSLFPSIFPMLLSPLGVTLSSHNTDFTIKGEGSIPFRSPPEPQTPSIFSPPQLPDMELTSPPFVALTPPPLFFRNPVSKGPHFTCCAVDCRTYPHPNRLSPLASCSTYLLFAHHRSRDFSSFPFVC